MHHTLNSHLCIFLFSGLDPNRYRTTTVNEEEGRQFGSLDSAMADSERFKDADQLIVRCRSCLGEVAFAPIGDREVRPAFFKPALSG